MRNSTLQAGPDSSCSHREPPGTAWDTGSPYHTLLKAGVYSLVAGLLVADQDWGILRFFFKPHTNVYQSINSEPAAKLNIPCKPSLHWASNSSQFGRLAAHLAEASLHHMRSRVSLGCSAAFRYHSRRPWKVHSSGPRYYQGIIMANRVPPVVDRPYQRVLCYTEEWNSASSRL